MTLFHLYRGSSCLSIGSPERAVRWFSNPIQWFPIPTTPVVLLSNPVDPSTLNGFSWQIKGFIYPIQLILQLSMHFSDQSSGSTIQSSKPSYLQWVSLTNPVVYLSNLVDPPTSSGFPWPIQWFIYPIQFILLLSMRFYDQSRVSSIQSCWSSCLQWFFLTNPVVHLSHLTVP